MTTELQPRNFIGFEMRLGVRVLVLIFVLLGLVMLREAFVALADHGSQTCITTWVGGTAILYVGLSLIFVSVFLMVSLRLKPYFWQVLERLGRSWAYFLPVFVVFNLLAPLAEGTLFESNVCAFAEGYSYLVQSVVSTVFLLMCAMLVDWCFKIITANIDKQS